MNKIRVLFVLPNLSGGGAERVIVNIIKHIDRSKFDVTLLLLGEKVGPLVADLPVDLEVVALKQRRAILSIFHMIAFVRRSRPEIVLSALDHINALLCIARCAFPRRTKHIPRITDFGSLKVQGIRAIYKIFLRHSSAIVVQSQEMGREFSRAFNVQQDRIFVINNPIDFSMISGKIGEIKQRAVFSRPLIVASGRLESAKGFDILIEALSGEPKMDVDLEILGDGSARGYLEGLIIEKNLQDRVRLLGFVNNPYEKYSSADIFVLSSRHEGFPNVVLEALACGTPVVAMPLPGVVRLLSGEAGCEVAADVSVDALAKAIHRQIAKGPLRVGQEAILGYEASSVARCYGELFLSVASQEGAKVARD